MSVFTHDEPTKAGYLAATGTAVATPCRVMAVYIRSTTTAGSVNFRDNGAGGDSLFVLHTNNIADATAVPLPDPGVLFGTDVHLTMSNVDGVTVFYGDL